MAKQRKMKLTINDEVKAVLTQPFDELISRGAIDFDISEVLSRVLSTSAAKKVIDEFVDENTPESFKINQLLSDPSEREKVLELLKDKSFGMAGEGGKGLSL